MFDLKVVIVRRNQGKKGREGKEPLGEQHSGEEEGKDHEGYLPPI